MTAYDKTTLDALRTRETAQEWLQEGLLSEEKWASIQAKYSGQFYSPNLFVRIGLAIFSNILLSAAFGLSALIASTNSDEGMSMLCFLFGVLSLAALEGWAIGMVRHFRSGVDDMLLYYGTGLILSSIFMLMPFNTSILTYSCIALPFLLVGSIRYLDRLMAAATFFCALLIVLWIVKEVPDLALYLLPFSGMLFAAAWYVTARTGQKRYDWRYWHAQLMVVEILSLLLFYASGNYWVIQQTGADWFHLEQVPITGFFWTFTILVPVVYILLGLLKKDRILLDIGLACVAMAVFTFRFYFHVFPLAWTAVISGAGLFALAYFSIRYLRNNASKFSYEADRDATLLQEIEQQLIEQTISSQNPPNAPEKRDSFGGGAFGGSGAGGDF